MYSSPCKLVNGEYVIRSSVIKIDLSSIKKSDELHSALSNSLNFPGWYGRNWDAFWDAISALVEMPKELEFYGWNVFSERMPHHAKMLQQCLTQLAAEFPELAPEVRY